MKNKSIKNLLLLAASVIQFGVSNGQLYLETTELVTLKVGTDGATRAERRTDIRGLRDFLVRFAGEL